MDDDEKFCLQALSMSRYDWQYERSPGLASMQRASESFS